MRAGRCRRREADKSADGCETRYEEFHRDQCCFPTRALAAPCGSAPPLRLSARAGRFGVQVKVYLPLPARSDDVDTFRVFLPLLSSCS